MIAQTFRGIDGLPRQLHEERHDATRASRSTIIQCKPSTTTANARNTPAQHHRHTYPSSLRYYSAANTTSIRPTIEPHNKLTKRYENRNPFHLSHQIKSSSKILSRGKRIIPATQPNPEYYLQSYNNQESRYFLWTAARQAHIRRRARDLSSKGKVDIRGVAKEKSPLEYNRRTHF